MKVNNNTLTNLYKSEVEIKSPQLEEMCKWFDSYTVNPLLSYISQEDINNISRIADSTYYSNPAHMKERNKELDTIMANRGFLLLNSGRNRRAYYHAYDNRVVMRIIIDKDGGRRSNLSEYIAQRLIRPFCVKIFEVSPCGTVQLSERVVPIITQEEFAMYAEDIFNILWFQIRNKDIVVDDIGLKDHKQWGYRPGFGPVLIDFPTFYVGDLDKRYCKKSFNGVICDGTIDYDDGFDIIRCNCCGTIYSAKQLASVDGDNIDKLMAATNRLIQKGKGRKMKIKLTFKNEDGTAEEVINTSSGGMSKVVSGDKPKKKNIGVKITVAEEEPETKAEVVEEVKKEENEDMYNAFNNGKVDINEIFEKLQKANNDIDEEQIHLIWDELRINLVAKEFLDKSFADFESFKGCLLHDFSLAKFFDALYSFSKRMHQNHNYNCNTMYKVHIEILNKAYEDLLAGIPLSNTLGIDLDAGGFGFKKIIKDTEDEMNKASDLEKLPKDIPAIQLVGDARNIIRKDVFVKNVREYGMDNMKEDIIDA